MKNISNYSNDNFFIENKGQEHPDIKYLLEKGATTLILRENGYSYSVMDIEKYSQIIKNKHDGIANGDLSINHHLVHQTFLNTQTPSIYSKEKTTTLTNYIHGNDPEKWGIGILPSKEVYYDELYKGIDLRYVSLENEIKYELIVEAHAKTNVISFNYKGQDSLYIDNFGRLTLNTSLGKITEDPPFVYQKIDNQIIEIKSSYKLKNGVVTYKLGHYNKNHELIIDPNLIFSTYSGTSANNWGNTACFDNEGSLYAGSTVFQRQYLSISPTQNAPLGSFVYTSGAFQTTFRGGDIDMGIIKFNSSGTNALYATYYGGADAEVPISLITDDNNNLYILAVTSSKNLIRSNISNSFSGGSTLRSVGYNFNEGTDIYLTKLNNQGLPINSRYYGGSGNDGLAALDDKLNQNYKNQFRGDIVIDQNGDVIIASYTSSTNLGTINSFNPLHSGDTDGIITKFDSSLTEVKWSGYIGNNNSDALYSLDIDFNNDVFACGTEATSRSHNGIIAKISSDGSRLIAQTKLETVNGNEAYFIRSDRNGNIYVTGQTESSYNIVNANFNVANGGNFIHAFSNDLSRTIFSTSFGVPNSQALVPSAFMIDDCNRIYFTGWGNLSNSTRTGGIPGLVTTPDAIKRSSDGYDFYLMVLEENANDLLYGSYLGGSAVAEHLDGGMSRFDPSGIVYQAVCTGCEITCSNGDCNTNESGNFPLFPNSSNTIFPRQKGQGTCNSAVFKFDLSNSSAEISLDGKCQDNEVIFQNNSFGATNFIWDFGDGSSTINTVNADPVTHNYTETGAYTIILTAESITQCSELLTDSITVFITSNTDTETFGDTLCDPEAYLFDFYSDTTNFFYRWLNTAANEINNANIPDPIIQLSETKDYYIEVSDEFGCSKIDTFAFVNPIINDNINLLIEPSCSQYSVGRIRFQNETSKSGTNSTPTYLWEIGDLITDEKQPATIVYNEPDSINIALNIKLDQCSYDTSFTAVFKDVVYPNIISPNGDGKNDTYKIIGIEEGQWEVTFTNRWGKQIYKSTDYQNDFGDSKLREGTYYYLITSPDETRCKGWLQVVK